MDSAISALVNIIILVKEQVETVKTNCATCRLLAERCSAIVEPLKACKTTLSKKLLDILQKKTARMLKLCGEIRKRSTMEAIFPGKKYKS
jgi:hypothetical protein